MIVTESVLVAAEAADKLNRELLRAAKKGEVDRVSTLLAQGAAANAEDKGFTALMWSARSGNIRLAQLLIDHRANVNATFGAYWMKRTAMTYAMRFQHQPMVALLTEHGAVDRNSETVPEDEAAHFGASLEARLESLSAAPSAASPVAEMASAVAQALQRTLQTSEAALTREEPAEGGAPAASDGGVASRAAAVGDAAKGAIAAGYQHTLTAVDWARRSWSTPVKGDATPLVDSSPAPSASETVTGAIAAGYQQTLSVVESARRSFTGAPAT
jgi:hypothetical protein